MLRFVGFLLALLIAQWSPAATWTEIYDPDGGLFPISPKPISGTGELSTIYGRIDGLDVDLYRIYLPDPSHTFSAVQSVPVGGNVFLGPQLFLFDDRGMGVFSTLGSSGFSPGPGLWASNPLAPTKPGYYWLGIAPSEIRAYTAKIDLGPYFPRADFPIFWPCDSSGCGPTPEGMIYPLGGWGGGYHGIDSPYVIQLTGAYFSAPTVPEPESIATMLVGLALLGVAARRNFMA